ncbi:GNAT family N-acetyltransferase [Plastorhodobacter daqingensis]|uniref:GNAT family N-acetyltransferase n=1 Tax=Plastorhodobacter daqingensis TaxID=1387281 RepID=A0ABW2UI02_9RHOB
MTDHLAGSPLPDWTAPARPGADPIEGHYVVLEPLNAEAHAGDLFQAFSAADDTLWQFMAHGPFHSAAVFHRWVKDATARSDMVYHALRDTATGHPGGVAAFMRITPEHGVIEIGSITLAPQMQRSPAATEAFALMIGWAFDAGYRRVEWKCDARNTSSRRAAQRLGFSYEGTFRQHMVIKGRNRDTAWFAVTDQDWPALREAYGAWLRPGNFDAEGRQIERLSDMTSLVRVASDPTL